jgi:hypothetical protein
MKLDVKLESRGARELIARCRRMVADDRREAHGMAAKHVLLLTRQHLERYAAAHHGTADRLGAPRTGHLEKAATETFPTHDGAGFGVSIHSPGIQRARRDLEITPREAKALTIPLHALAYGRRAADVERTFGHSVFIPRKKDGGKANILATKIDGRLVALYALVQRAKVPQDASLMPTDAELRQAAAEGLGRGIMDLIHQGRA